MVIIIDLFFFFLVNFSFGLFQNNLDILSLAPSLVFKKKKKKKFFSLMKAIGLSHFSIHLLMHTLFGCIPCTLFQFNFFSFLNYFGIQ